MKKKIASALVTSFILAGTACSSKYQEGAPAGSSQDVDSKREYTIKTQGMKSRIEQTQQLLNGFNDIVAKLSGKDFGNGNVSDVVVQILESVRNSSIEKAKDGSYVSYGEIYLVIPGLSTECRTVKTRSIYDEKKSTASQDIALKTCKTNNQYVSAMTITVDDKKGVSVITNKKIESILPDINLREMLAAQNCKLETFSSLPKGKQRRITCQAGDLVLNSREKVEFSDLIYSELSVDANMFTATGEFFKQGATQFKMIIELSKDGKLYTSLVDTRPKENSIEK